MTFLLACTIRISVVFLLALGSMRLLRNQSAAVRHCVLSTAILFAAALPFLSLVLPAWNLPALPIVKPIVQPLQTRFVQTVTINLPPTITDGEVTPAQTQTASGLAAAIYVGGVMAGILFLLVGMSRLLRITASAHPLATEIWTHIASTISTEFRLWRRVELLETRNASILVNWGVLSPAVLLPAGAAQWEEERARIVLRHELAHVHRFDWPIQMLSQIVRIAFWFNPLIWIVCRRLKLESERSCDDATISAGTAGPEYAALLLQLAEELNHPGRSWSAALGMIHLSPLERRFAAMINPEINRRPLSSRAMLATVLIVAAVVLPLSALSSSVPLPVYSVLGAIPAPTPAGTFSSVATPAAGRAAKPFKKSVQQSLPGQLLGRITDTAGRAVAGVSVLVSSPFPQSEIDRLDAARKERETAEANLETERIRFNQATTTLRNVFIAERIAAQAKTDEIDAVIAQWGSGPAGLQVVTSADTGNFSFPSLPAGTYGLRIFSPDGQYSVISNIEIKSGTVTRELFRLAPVLMTRGMAGDPAPSTVVTTRLAVPGSMPVLIKKVDPLYPPEGRRLRFQGTVVLEAIIGADGVPQVSRIVRSLDSGFGGMCRKAVANGDLSQYRTPADCPETLGFDEAAANAFSQWRFTPAMKDGVPVPVFLNVEVSFSLAR